MILLRFVNQLAHLGDRDHRQDANEQKDQGQEQAERAVERRIVPERPVIHRPRRRQKIAMQAGDDDHVPLEPHADIHQDRNQPQER